MNFTLSHELGTTICIAITCCRAVARLKSDFRSADEMGRKPTNSHVSVDAAHLPGGQTPAERLRAEQLCDRRESSGIGHDYGAALLRDIEPCAAIFSRYGVVEWACYSEDMKRLNMGFVPFRQPLPQGSRTVKKADDLNSAGHIEGDVNAGEWFERPFHKGNLWEESLLLGSDGLALTYLTPPNLCPILGRQARRNGGRDGTVLAQSPPYSN